MKTKGVRSRVVQGKASERSADQTQRHPSQWWSPEGRLPMRGAPHWTEMARPSTPNLLGHWLVVPRKGQELSFDSKVGADPECSVTGEELLAAGQQVLSKRCTSLAAKVISLQNIPWELRVGKLGTQGKEFKEVLTLMVMQGRDGHLTGSTSLILHPVCFAYLTLVPRTSNSGHLEFCSLSSPPEHALPSVFSPGEI